MGKEGEAAREKGRKWLKKAKPAESPQGAALRLLLWKRLGRPAKECDPLVKQLLGS